MDHPCTSRWKRLASALGWTRSSYFVMSAFLATIIVIGVVWWPLLKAELAYFDRDRPLWEQLDWLLLGDFVAMSLLIMVNPDLKSDVLIVLVAFMVFAPFLHGFVEGMINAELDASFAWERWGPPLALFAFFVANGWARVRGA